MFSSDEKSDLLGIMNAGRDRMTARVMRAEAIGDGKFKVREFNTFAPIALDLDPGSYHARFRIAPSSLPLRRATQDERPERLTLRTRGPLIDIGRRLTRWAIDLNELPDPHCRRACTTGSRTCGSSSFRSPRLAGGDWPERCRKAALADLAREEANDADGGRNADLLADVWEIFYDTGKMKMHTDELCNALCRYRASCHGAPRTAARPVDGYLSAQAPCRLRARRRREDRAEEVA